MPIFMKIEGIEGTGTGKYKGWIPLESCQVGSNRNIGSGVSGQEVRAPTKDIVITRIQDSSSPELFKHSAFGDAVGKVTIDFVAADAGAPYLSIEMESVFVSSYSLGKDNGKTKPSEAISLSPGKITYTNKPTAGTKNDTAQEKATWDAQVQ